MRNEIKKLTRNEIINAAIREINQQLFNINNFGNDFNKKNFQKEMEKLKDDLIKLRDTTT